jgi:transcriptional regulator with XRE-family HTH domain
MTMAENDDDFTPRHVKAARALLAWSQQDLAKAAGVAASTVADFERGHRTPIANNAQAIRGALESANIQFLPNGAVIGPAIPVITRSADHGTPVRWVTAEDLSDWANRTDGAMSLPTLLDYLIVATHGSAIRRRFPSDEGVRHAGWDGRTSTETGSTYVPEGDAGWEVGTQRSKIAQKANDDYNNRTADPVPLDSANATFVFVTPRHWSKKDEWAKARKDEGRWRDVRAYDANDLVHWIEQTPAVGLWLAIRLNKRPPGTRELEEVWKEWSLATEWPLTEELVLTNRDDAAAELLRWLRGKPSVFSLQATTTDEAVAFFHATLNQLPDDYAATYRSLCLVATTAEAARAVAGAAPPLILLLTDPDPGLARRLAEQGHFVLQAYDERLATRGGVRSLNRPSREGIASALSAAGISRPRAEVLARDSARNLSVLRRLIPAAPGRRPKWAENPDRALLVALLAGGWDENAEGDKAVLSKIAAQPYEAIVAALNPYVGEFDSPLQKVGSCWRVTSPFDAWFQLAGNLTSVDISRFEEEAHAVLGSADPRFDLPPDERWMAAVRGVHPAYSEIQRHGIGQVLILLALWGDQVRTVPDAGRRADAIVRKLLRNADQQRWWSLSRDFRLLAEASPDSFLTAIEDSLDQDTPSIGVLFGHDKGGLFGTEHLSDLMWALESLAWSPDWMPRVTRVLARLDDMDTRPRRYSNGPANSLREIHLLWGPQTFATLDQRLRALDLIRKKETNAAWKLMLKLLPQGFDSSSPSPMPRWRDFTVEKVETVTRGLIARGAAEISKRLLDDIGLSPVRWSELLDRFGDLAPDPEHALAKLEAAEPRITDEADRSTLLKALRCVLHKHRRFPDADWSLPKPVLEQLESVYYRFAPADPLERKAWLFQQPVQLPEPSTAGWETEQRDVDDARQRAVHEVYAEGGLPAVFSLARMSETAGYIGKALYDSGLPVSDIDLLIEAGVRSEEARERDVAHGLIVSVSRERKEPWSAALIAKAKAGNWNDTALLTILRALPIERWTWDQVAQIGGEMEATYWRQTPVFWMSENSEDVAYAIRMLIGVGRARHALPLAARDSTVHLASDLLVEVLRKALPPTENSGDSNEVVMFQHYVSEIFQILDQRDDVSRSDLVSLEWAYLPVLEHSPRPARVLLQALAEDPKLFIEVLCAVFKPSEESGVVEPEPEDPERARALATQAYRVLHLWNHIPGKCDDGTINGEALEAWIKEARALAKAAGRADIADSRIGNMLSTSPMGLDGNWPAEPIREVIDLFRSRPMIDGFRIGKYNLRGVTTRGPRDGGKLERQEAAKYRTWSKAIEYDHPHTAKTLAMLAESYDQDARRHDEDVERLDW